MNFNSVIPKNIKSFVDANRQMIFFVARVMAIYFFWKFMVWFLGEESQPIDERMWPWLSHKWEIFNDWVRIGLLHTTSALFELFGYPNTIINNYRLYVHNYARIGVGNYCLGIQLWIFFAALISSYPGYWKKKIIYSIIGIIGINLINIWRLSVLVFAVKYYPQYVKFNHDYVFNVIVYIFTFVMWYYIVQKNKLAKPEKK